MPNYVTLIQWTEQGIRNVRESPKRAEAARKLAEQLGGKVWLWYTMGDYDLVSIGEFPNDEAYMQFALQIGSLGNARTKSLKAWSEADAVKVIGTIR